MYLQKLNRIQRNAFLSSTVFLLVGVLEYRTSYDVFTEPVGSIHATGNATLLRAELIPRLSKNANSQQHVI